MGIGRLDNLLGFGILKWNVLWNSLQLQNVFWLKWEFPLNTLVGEDPILLLFKSQPYSQTKVTERCKFVKGNTKPLEVLLTITQFEMVASLCNFLQCLPDL